MTDNAEANLELFFDRIDEWIISSGFIKSKVSMENIDAILSLSGEVMYNSTSESLMQKSFELYGYIDSIQEIYNKEKAVVDFCEEAIWRIITPVFNNYGDQYTKWEYKYNCAVRENPLANKVNILKNTTKARLISIEHRVEHAKKRADILYEIARRRKNEQYT